MESVIKFITNVDPVLVLTAVGFVLSEIIGLSKAESSGVLSLLSKLFKRK